MPASGALALPMLLTWARIALVPFVVVVFYLPVPWGGTAAAALFVCAGLTDWFDGYLARRLDQTSSFGAFLDPVADKLMVTIALVIVVEATGRGQGLPASLVVAVSAAIILARELAVSALRQWAARRGAAAAAALAVSPLAKAKTATQMIALTLLLPSAAPGPGAALFGPGAALLAVAAALACWSLAHYVGAVAAALHGAGGTRDGGA